MVKKIISKIKSLYLYNLMCGNIISCKIRKNNKNTYLVTSHGIGDIAWTCVFIGDYINKINNQCIIITEERFVEIMNTHIKSKNVIFKSVSHKELMYLEYYASSSFNKKTNIIPLFFPLIKMKKQMIKELDLLSKSGAEMDMLYKIGCLELYNKTNIKPLEIYKESNYNIKKDIIPKVVLLIPGVNSRNNISEKIWEDIAKICCGNGYKVYTNMGAHTDNVINGTYPLNMTINELPQYISDKKIKVISSRCGLADFLFLSGCCDILILHSIIKDVKINQLTEIYNRFAYWENFHELNQKYKITSHIVYDFRLEIAENKCINYSELKWKICNYISDKEE